MLENDKNKELNDEELENVNGGYLCTTDDTWAEDHMKFLPNKNVQHIGKGDVGKFVARYFYMVNDTDPESYCYGKLVSSDGSTHTILVESVHDHAIPHASVYNFVDVKPGDTISKNANAYTMFLVN